MTATAIATDQNIWVTTPLPDGTLLLEEMSGQEHLGAPFGYELALLSLKPDVDLSGLLGLRITVHVKMANGERQFNGIVTQVEQGSTDGDFTRYRVTLRPWLSMLAYTSNCRIFQEKSVVDIVKEVFRDNGFSDFDDSLNETYDPMEYCVQYRESDLNFVTRLMEHEGIYYYFKHAGEKHTLVLADGYSAHDSVPGYDEVPYKPPHGYQGDVDHLNSWTVAQQIRPGSYAATDFDFTRPRANLMSKLSAPLNNAQADFALYDYPGDFLTTGAGNTRVKMRLQEAQVSYEVVQTAGDTRGLGAGVLFTLTDFPRDDQNKEYLIISAQYQIHAAVFMAGATHGSDDFRVHLAVMDSQTQYRPGLHAAKPRVEGVQTAIVVGQSGQEIWTDQYGRVKVQFHWDRIGTDDEKSSCWVRVAQLWAGSGWGGIHIPRIGQEVIVDFLEGDPDRPIITGRVYNADNMPPYGLPANQTQSGIKSRSSPGGSPSNFNEVRFEDKKGSEELFVQAEKDQNTLVKNDQSLTVNANRTKTIGGDETVKVSGNRTETVSKDETITVTGNRTESVGKNEGITIGQNQTLTVGKNRSVSVASNESISIGVAQDETVGATKTVSVGAAYSLNVGAAMSEGIGGAKTVSVGAVSSESVGGSKSVSAGGNISESASGGFSIDAGKDVAVTAGKNFNLQASENCAVSAGKKGSIDAGDELTIACGDATIVLKKNGDITINGKKIQVTASGDLVLKGSKIAGN